MILKQLKAWSYIITTCEKLSTPWTTSPSETNRLDKLARYYGVTVMGSKRIFTGLIYSCVWHNRIQKVKGLSYNVEGMNLAL